MTIRESTVLERLDAVEDPALGGSIVDLGLIRGVRVDPATVHVTAALRAPYAPDERLIQHRIRTELADLGREVRIYAEGAGDPGVLQHANAVAVTAGDRGVGKTTVAVNAATELAGRGARVGVLDADGNGPSAAELVGLPDDRRRDAAERFVPAETDGLKLLCADWFRTDGRPTAGRPPEDGLLTALVCDVEWRPLDYLFVSLPPGGEAGSGVGEVGMAGAVLATTTMPDEGNAAIRTVSTLAEHDIPVLGIAETVRSFQRASGGRSTDGAGGEALATAVDRRPLGPLPVDRRLRHGSDGEGDDDRTRAAYAAFVDAVTNEVGKRQRRAVRRTGEADAASPPDGRPRVTNVGDWTTGESGRGPRSGSTGVQ
ncbi:P-loop NTPase [Halostella salina]|uniref:P-loop NTPase n=1 Tax=Halostella salina TaxID=1547897 RepID=UPI000EF77097|nr:P-loop NTPase [Halostella salina]